jgi:membrane protein
MRIFDAIGRGVDRGVAGYDRGVLRLRKRSHWFDHFWLARMRYNDESGGRLAAAISYYAFFAAFSLALVGYSILGYVLEGREGLIDEVNAYLQSNLPWVTSTQQVAGSRGTLTVVSSIALVLTGLGWVEALCSSQRSIWRVNQYPGNWFIRRLVDLGMLAGLAVLLGLSLAASAAIEKVLDVAIIQKDSLLGATALRLSGPVLEFGVNVVLAAALLAAVPRLRMRVRRLLPAALIVAIGIQVLNSLGRYFIGRTQHNPAYSLVGTAAGLLVYLYLLHQLIMFGAALIATGHTGNVVDLAAGPGDDALASAAHPPERPGEDRTEPDTPSEDRIARDTPGVSERPAGSETG